MSKMQIFGTGTEQMGGKRNCGVQGLVQEGGFFDDNSEIAIEKLKIAGYIHKSIRIQPSLSGTRYALGVHTKTQEWLLSMCALLWQSVSLFA